MKISNRRKARKLALQAIYQWQLNPESVATIEAQYLTEANAKKIDLEYFSALLRGVIINVAAIDEAMSQAVDRKINELNPIELAALRLAIFELLFHLEVPVKVVINESLEIVKTFGSVDGYKYVNGVLDKLAQGIRKEELKGRGENK